MYSPLTATLSQLWSVLRQALTRASLLDGTSHKTKTSTSTRGRSKGHHESDTTNLHQHVPGSAGRIAGGQDQDDFWSDIVGAGLSTLMQGAKYDSEAQAAGQQFFDRHVLSYLGAIPNNTSSPLPHWRSFMTDDFSPVEYSWSWDMSPKIRYSFEPIGKEAGSRRDPFNRAEPLACIESMRQSMPESDWRLFEQVDSQFHDSSSSSSNEKTVSMVDDDNNVESTDLSLSSPSSIMLAVEIGRRDTMAKVYLVPVRAQQQEKARFTVLQESLDDLQTSLSLKLPACSSMTGYINKCERTGSPLDLIGVAVDCVDPCLAKLKIYLRSQGTSFNQVMSTLTMDGLVGTWNNETIKAELWELWCLVLGLGSDAQHDDPLLRNSHETGGILYNFDIQTNNKLPDTKLYIPVKHYAKNDRQVLDGLKTFLNKRGHAAYTEGFDLALEELASSYRKLEDGCGLQTYISCAVKKGRLQLTSYMSAEVYHANRWQRRAQ